MIDTVCTATVHVENLNSDSFYGIFRNFHSAECIQMYKNNENNNNEDEKSEP
jgi:hypothetical protein